MFSKNILAAQETTHRASPPPVLGLHRFGYSAACSLWCSAASGAACCGRSKSSTGTPLSTVRNKHHRRVCTPHSALFAINTIVCAPLSQNVSQQKTAQIRSAVAQFKLHDDPREAGVTGLLCTHIRRLRIDVHPTQPSSRASRPASVRKHAAAHRSSTPSVPPAWPSLQSISGQGRESWC